MHTKLIGGTSAWLPTRPDDLRHTYATWLEDAGISARVVEAIQQRLTVVLGVAELAVERHPNR